MTTAGVPIGLTMSSLLPPERLSKVAQLAERHGLSELWPVEDYFFYGGLAGATAILGATSQIPVGVGIVSALARHPAVLAMEIATIERMYPGRFWPGIGLGVSSWIEQMGYHPKSPLSVLRECVTGVRRLLDGEEVTEAGSVFTFDRIKLVHPPERRPPLYMGVIGPKMLELSGEIADGTVVSVLASRVYIRWLRERVAAGQQTAGRTDHHRVATFALYSVDHDRAKARAAIRDVMAFYLWAVPRSSLTDVYGVGEQLWDMYTRGGADSGALINREMPDAWLDDLVIAGDPDECAAKIDALLDAGADSVNLFPVPTDRAEEIVEITGRDVLPLLRHR